MPNQNTNKTNCKYGHPFSAENTRVSVRTDGNKNTRRACRECARAAVRLSTNAKRKLVREAKDKPCTDCKIRYPYYIMQFDHLSDKVFELGGNMTIATHRILAEIAKCEVVCSNCHAERTYQRKQLLPAIA